MTTATRANLFMARSLGRSGGKSIGSPPARRGPGKRAEPKLLRPLASENEVDDLRHQPCRGVHHVDRVVAVDVAIAVVERHPAAIGDRDIVIAAVEIVADRKPLTLGEELAGLARRQAAIVLAGETRRAIVR